MDDMTAITDGLLESDRRHLIHPLHHPKDHLNPKVYAKADGAILTTVDGKDYIDGLSCLWNASSRLQRELRPVRASQDRP